MIYATCDIYYHMWWQVGFPMAQTVRNLPAMQETQVQSLSQEDHLENYMDRGAWWAIVHEVSKAGHD